jgi:hypothetical protein
MISGSYSTNIVMCFTFKHITIPALHNYAWTTQVHGNWRIRLEAYCTCTRVLEAYCEQVSICTEIGLSSMEYDRHNRPNIVEIVNKLDETETMVEKVISSC